MLYSFVNSFQIIQNSFLRILKRTPAAVNLDFYDYNEYEEQE